MQDSLHHDHKPVLITTGTLLLPRYFSQLQPSLDTKRNLSSKVKTLLTFRQKIKEKKLNVHACSFYQVLSYLHFIHIY